MYSQWMYEYNSIGRGLTALLILAKGQCEGLNSGMGEEVRFSHAFFVSVGVGPVSALMTGRFNDIVGCEALHKRQL